MRKIKETLPYKIQKKDLRSLPQPIGDLAVGIQTDSK